VNSSYHEWHDVAKLVLESGGATNGKCELNNPFKDSVVTFVYPLYQAVAQATTRAVGLLLDNGADVNAVGGPFGTALHVAPLLFDINSSTRVVLTDLLLKSGADIEADSGHGTPLYLAALFGNVDGLRLLLDHGA
jgi:ankyrin repeat protein